MCPGADRSRLVRKVISLMLDQSLPPALRFIMRAEVMPTSAPNVFAPALSTSCITVRAEVGLTSARTVRAWENTGC